MSTLSLILVFQLIVFMVLLGTLLWLGLRISQNSPVNVRRGLFITVIVAMLIVMLNDVVAHGFAVSGYFLLPVIVIIFSLAMLVQTKE